MPLNELESTRGADGIFCLTSFVQVGDVTVFSNKKSSQPTDADTPPDAVGYTASL
jgi:hypothetical protein